MKTFIRVLFTVACLSASFSKDMLASDKPQHNLPSGKNAFLESLSVGELSSRIEFDSLVRYNYNTPDDSVRSNKNTFTYDSESRITEQFNYTWDVTNEAWKLKTKYKFGYDQKDNMVLSEIYGYVNGGWVGYIKEEYGYDEDGNETLYALYDSWNDTLKCFIPEYKEEKTFLNGYKSSSSTFLGSPDYTEGLDHSVWVPSYRNEYARKANGNLISQTGYRWSEEDRSWINQFRNSCTYDDQERQILVEFAEYREGDWINISKSESTFVGLSFLTMLYNFDQQLNMWETAGKLEGTRDEQGYILTQFQYIYFPVDDFWLPSSKSEYTFDNNGYTTSQIESTWNSQTMQWVYKSKNVNLYDENNQNTLSSEFKWDDTRMEWFEMKRSEWFQDNYGNITTIKSNFEDSTGWKSINYVDENGNIIFYEQYSGIIDEWNLSVRGFYYIKEEVQTVISENEPSDLQIFPNPSSDFIRVRGIITAGSIFIYDLRGSLMMEKAVDRDGKISISSLPTGVYIVIISSSERKVKTKLVKN